MTKKDEDTRRPWVTPELESVRLMPEEMILGACKNPGKGGCPRPSSPVGQRPGS